MDIAWSRIEDNLIAGGRSNGEIHRLIVTPTGLKSENSFQCHSKTINKISFHPNDGNKLLSGGQDGLVCFSDMRSLDKILSLIHI